MGLKSFYYKLEDKYYNFVERTGLYKITDKIDRVMPSFILFILLILILIAGILLLIFSGSRIDSVDVNFKVIDAETGNLLEDVSLVIISPIGIETVLTKSDGTTDNIKLPKETSFQIEIVKDGYENYSEYLQTKDYSESITIALEPVVVVPPTVTYNFSVINSETNQVVQRSGAISFKCLNNVVAPASQTLSSGNVTVHANPDCQLVIDSISFMGFLPRYDVPISQGTSTISLQPDDFEFVGGDDYTLGFNVKNTSQEPLDKIKITLTNDFGIVDTCITNLSGSCSIGNLSKGNYTANFSDIRTVPLYTTLTKNYYVSEDSVKNEILSTDVKGYIYVRVVGQGGQFLEGAEVSLKNEVNNTIETKSSNEDGEVIFTTSEIKSYKVVVDAEGYLIRSIDVLSKEEMPTNPTSISLILITPGTLAKLNVKVVSWDGRGYSFAKVVLYDAETGFLTDYKPQVTDYEGRATFNITSGRYIAKAVKGNNVSQEVEFEFNVKFPDLTDEVVLPMGLNQGILNVNVLDKENSPVPFARVDLYDRYSYYNDFPAIPIRSIDTDSQGRVQFSLDADVDYYVVASPLLEGDYGKTQSRFIRLSPDVENNLNVTLFNKNSAQSKPRMEFIGLFRDDLEIQENLRAGEDYEIRYYLLVPQNRTGNDRFDEIGFVLRTGSTSMIENDSLFIKNLDMPYIDSIQKYTQFNMAHPHESEGFSDFDSDTEGDFKWAKVNLKEGPLDYSGELGYFNVYEVSATISIKDSAVFGEELKIHSLAYGKNKSGIYETFPEYLGPNNHVQYFDVYNILTYGIGDELFCSDDFCMSSTIIDIIDDLRYDVSDSFSAKPNRQYKYTFTLINNSNETRYLSSRFILENIDQGLDIQSINIIKPDGEVYTQNNPTAYNFDIPISQLNPKQKVTGEIIFTTRLQGVRNLSIKFISDQRVRFVNQFLIDVVSDKSLDVKVQPTVVPSGKNFNLVVNSRDLQTNLPVENATVTVRDKFKDVIFGPVNIPMTGEAMLSNIPAQAPNDKIYVHVSAPDYETNITELTATDRLFSITPRSLAYSLNVFTEKQRTESFTINNISPIDLTIDSLEVRGTGLEIVDILRINNDLLNSVGIVIKGLDTISDLPDNKEASKEIPLTISLNPRSEAIREMQNLSATLKIVLRSGDNSWVSEVPIRVNVGFDGMLDNPECLTLSESFWKEVSLDKPVDTAFMINNTCTLNNNRIPLSSGLEARVMFESNPQGRFILSIDNRNVELTHGSYRPLLDTVDRDRSYPILLRYEPVGRMTGTVKGKVQFRSLNSTGTGNQELISEFNFEIDVTNLRDCVVFSKRTLNVGRGPDEFTIENKACPADMVYRLSCDDCPGLIIEPRREVEVSRTGTSPPIVVSSVGAVPGAYVLSVFGDMAGSRQSERPINTIKVYVRPTDYCLDLERYEFDLYRSEYSESTGLLLPASSYDTTNIVNLCYSQEVTGVFTVKEDARWKTAAVAFFRDGLYTTGVSGLIQSLFDSDTSWWGKITGRDGNKLDNAKDSAQDLIEKINSNEELDSEKKEALAPFINTLNNAINSGDIGKIQQATRALENQYNQLITPKEEIDDDEKLKDIIEESDKLIEKIESDEELNDDQISSLTPLKSSLIESINLDSGVPITNVSEKISEIEIRKRDLEESYNKFKNLGKSNELIDAEESLENLENILFLNRLDDFKNFKNIVIETNNKINLIANEEEKNLILDDFSNSNGILANKFNIALNNISISNANLNEDNVDEYENKIEILKDILNLDILDDELKDEFNEAIENFEEIISNYKKEQSYVSVSELRVEMLKSATTGEVCDPNKNIGDEGEPLFNIRPHGDQFVYACTGDGRYRGCHIDNQKWAGIATDYPEDMPNHPVYQCKDFN